MRFRYTVTHLPARFPTRQQFGSDPEESMPDRRGSKSDVDHEAIILSIAQEMHYPIPIVKRIYEEELGRLKAIARVGDYLVLFASRRTRDLLLSARRQRSGVTA